MFHYIFEEKNKRRRELQGAMGQNRGRLWALFLTIAAIVFIGGLLYISGGNAKIVAAALVPMIVIGLTLYRLEYSFLLLFGCVLFFDQFWIPGFQPFTYYVDFFRNFKEISYLPSHPAGIINPIELYLMLLFGIGFLILVIRKKITLQSIPIWPAFLLFLSWLLLTFFNGLGNGGEMAIAFWESEPCFTSQYCI